MKKYEIHLADWQRILLGETPPLFMLEVLIRTLIVYIFLLFTLRWLGKRMSGQLTILEMAVMLTLGAIVSVGMQTPERGIALSMFVLVCTLLFQRGLSWWGIKSARMEELSQGKISTLLKNGVLEVDEMRRCRITKQQLFAQLRSKKVYNLGEVRRVYLEAYGMFTVIRMQQQQPGLPTFPPTDQSILRLLRHTGEQVCAICGTKIAHQHTLHHCPHCQGTSWVQAVISETK